MKRCLVLILFSLVAFPGRRLEGQNWDARGPEMSREELDSLLSRLDQAGASSAYSAELRDRSSSEAAAVRERLELGDFQAGDRILLQVDGEPALSDTFTVTAGPVVTLPVTGAIRLRGVLRAELPNY